MNTSSSTEAVPAPASLLDADAVRRAYRRWAGIYDVVFGGVSSFGRRRAVAEVNRLPGTEVLEVGVGTGLALPGYDAAKRVTGIDLSADMLRLARARVAAGGLETVSALLEMDAQRMDFADASFDVAVAMFVASVAPDPLCLLAEMRRVTRPGGHLLFVNHFAAESGARRWLERAAAPLSSRLGWHTDFVVHALLSPAELAGSEIRPVPPFGFFTLIRLSNPAPSS